MQCNATTSLELLCECKDVFSVHEVINLKIHNYSNFSHINKPDRNSIGSKHVARLWKQNYGFYNKNVLLNRIIHYPVKIIFKSFFGDRLYVEGKFRISIATKIYKNWKYIMWQIVVFRKAC